MFPPHVGEKVRNIVSKYDARVLDGRHDWRQPLPPITGWEWYSKENTEPVFILMLNPRKDAKGDMSGRKKTLIWEEWWAFKGWLRKQPTMWEVYREKQIDNLAQQAKAIGIVDTKVIGKNGSKKAIPSTIKGQEVPVIQFEDVDCNRLEQNIELFERLLEATSTMTNDEHCEAFKRLQQTIE